MTRGSVGAVRLAAMPSERASWQNPSFSDFGVFFRRMAAGIKSLFFDFRTNPGKLPSSVIGLFWRVVFAVLADCFHHVAKHGVWQNLRFPS